MSRKSLAVIGGGAAGFFGAIAAAEANPAIQITIFEGGQRPLSKVKISGGGRCNVTHNCFDAKRLIENYPRGRRELLGVFHRFQPKDIVSWFANHGVELKAEADGRMFPVTDSSETIIRCFMDSAARAGVELKKAHLLKDIKLTDSGFHLTFRNGHEYQADAVLWATGSLVQSYQLLKNLGHTIIDPVPSLFTFEINSELLDELAGQSFAQVQAKLQVGDAKFQQTGPLLITHWGLSGPAVLRLSAFAARELHASAYQAKLWINFVYPQNQESLLDHLLLTKEKDATKPIASYSPLTGMSRRFWRRCLEVLQIDPEQNWQILSKKDLRRISSFLVAVPFEVQGKGVFKEEFVTCGGVKLKEVNFKTMESKICPGLFLAGEVLDVDGITGGFNFQNAWSGSWLAAQTIAERLRDN